MSFCERVLKIVAKIPAGSDLSYAEVAKKAGSPRACRAVGNIKKKNFDPNIPCHRVINSGGKVGKYNRGGSSKKRQILKRENASSKLQ